MRVERVDEERNSNDLGAVVVGAGDGRRDRDEAERRAAEGTGHVDGPADVEWMRARTGGDVRRPDLRARRTTLERDLAAAELARGRGNGRLRAVAEPAQTAGEPRRHREIEVAQVL